MERIHFNEQSQGPKNLVFKKYGGNVLGAPIKEKLEINSPWIQSLIFYEQSHRGWGPKLLGLFEDGRVEEFVDCHTLRAEEAFKEDMVKDVAKAFARFHSHKFPFCHEQIDMLQKAMLSLESSKESLIEWVRSGQVSESHLAKYPIQELLNFPYESERQWVESIESKISQRVVFCTLDNNYLNRLVRNVKPSDEDATSTLIIDFDLSAYANRGFELAGHFVNQLSDDLAKDDKRSKFPFPSEIERKEFLAAYLEECKQVFDDFDPDSLDSLEHLTLEVDFNCCFYLLRSIIYCTQMLKMTQSDPGFGTILQPLLDVYKEVKENFRKKYSSLVN